MPSNFFTPDPNTCNACYRKHWKTNKRLGNVLSTISYTPSDDQSNDDRCDLIVFLNSRRAEIVDDITTELAEKHGVKCYLTHNLSMSRHSVDGDLYISEPSYVRILSGYFMYLPCKTPSTMRSVNYRAHSTITWA